MKLFLILVVFFCCIIIGVLIKKYFVKRQNFFCDLHSFCENLSNDISYNNEKLNLIINKNISIFNSDINGVLILFDSFLLNKITEQEFKQSVNQKLNFLSEKERYEIINFFINMGKYAKEEELQKILNFVSLINPIKDEVTEKNKKFSSLYFKLFLFLGIIFVIIFI